MTSRKSAIERARNTKKYNIYCISFHGSRLDSIKDIFKREVQTGRRRSVCILDLQELQDKFDKPTDRSLIKNTSNNLIEAVLQAIQELQKNYVMLAQKISEELNFDLYQYWMQDIKNKEKPIETNAKVKTALDKEAIAKTKSKQESSKTKPSKNSRNSINKKTLASVETEVVCESLKRKEHNRVGQGELLSKREYIRDEPSGDKLYIIIIGAIYEHFYLELLRRDQPVQGVLHYMPAKSNYDKLMNHSEIDSLTKEISTSINNSIYELRQNVSMKPVGIFTHSLPVISTCLANKYKEDIYEQLTWSIYDVDVLQQQYITYYCKPFREFDVKMPAEVNLKDLYDLASASRQTVPIHGNSSDIAIILSYLDNMLSVCAEFPYDDMATPLSKTVDNSSMDNCSHNSSGSAFESIIQIKHFDSLFVEETNQLMSNLLLYSNEVNINKVYLSCLNYNLWSQYVMISYPLASKLPKSDFSINHTLRLPEFIKLYTTEDSCRQRISELLPKYDDYDIVELQPGLNFYTFRRHHNVVIEQENLIVIPTRLCFRDFTLFQKQEFLDNLITPEINKVGNANKSISSLDKDNMVNNFKASDLDDKIFIRPNSLKASKLLREKESVSAKTLTAKEVSRSQDPRMIHDVARNSENTNLVLPPNHHLLQGYNLDDTRQELKMKTSKYYYEKGLIKLYEEQWCFQAMNKQLTLEIADSSIYFNGLGQEFDKVDHNIRIVTKNKINIRILNDPREYSKIIMSYPNGLCIKHCETHCEQIWSTKQSIQEEQRRILTPYGAIVVYFQAEHMILIMRYNGEVYKLFQNDYVPEEEEETVSSELSNLQVFESNDLEAQGDYLKQGFGGSEKDALKNEKSVIQCTKKLTETSSNEYMNSSTSSTTDLKHLLNYELEFLNFICSQYKLSYNHIFITSSQGRVLYLDHNGNIFQNQPYILDEWHDYHANESYCQRSDDVKMIWTQDSLKCYHADGSILISKTEESYELKNSDDFELQISQSSSHVDIEESQDMVENLNEKSLYANFITSENIEESEDPSFICYNISNCLMQHKSYAGVNFDWPRSNSLSETSVAMKIVGVDNILMYIEHLESDAEDRIEKISTVNIMMANDLHFKIDEMACEIHGVLRRPTVEAAASDSTIDSDSLTLKVSYNNGLTDIFKYLVNKISKFHGNIDQKTKDLYFVEMQANDGKSRGFEFLDSLPKSSGHTYSSSNCIMEIKPVSTINQLMTNNYKWIEEDMKKFPRFRTYKKKERRQTEQNFPLICSTSIYCKIPSSLQHTKDIKKILEPFEKINFKNFQHKIKKHLNLNSGTQLQIDIRKLSSSNSWFKRHRENEEQKLREEQRKGLYYAMLKYRLYPNYFKFRTDYECHVRNIDLFDFWKTQCENEKGK